MKSRWVEIAVNILFWALTVWIIAGGFSVESREIEIVNDTETIRTVRSESLMIRLLISCGISLILFYGNLLNLTRLSLKVQRINVTLTSLLILLAAFLVFYLINHLSLGEATLPLPLSLAAGILIFYFTISTAYGLGRAWILGERSRQQLQIAKHKAELNLLRNQLQPHFLFNALNNLLSMVNQQHSPILADSFDRLSQLLRYVVEEVNTEKVEIGKEITFIRNYVSLQLLRFEKGEVETEFMVRGDQLYLPVEPGLFITFVENAFKYGTEPENPARISILFDITCEARIRFVAENKIMVHRRENREGTGIRDLRRRLELVYPGRHSLDISREDRFRVELNIHTDEGDNRG